MMKHYDLIIVGGGVAGLSLACHLAQSPLRELSVLIIEQRPNSMGARSLCFWSREPTPFDGVVKASWDRVRVAGVGAEHVLPLQDYRYKLIPGADLYREAREQFAIRGGIDFVQGGVTEIRDGEREAMVTASGRLYAGRYVFDSCLRWSTIAPDKRHALLRQHVKVWMVEARGGTFDASLATMLDFRTPQQDGLCYFHVAPISDRQAMVECVAHGVVEFDRLLGGYLAEAHGLRAFDIVASAGGSSLLTDLPFGRRAGERIMNIGALGGRIKPSTGFGFMRIQRDSAAIVDSLRRRGHPFDVQEDPALYRLIDSVLLQLMSGGGGEMQALLLSLFGTNPPDRVFRFLDQRAGLDDVRAIMERLPAGLVLKTALGKLLQAPT